VSSHCQQQVLLSYSCAEHGHRERQHTSTSSFADDTAGISGAIASGAADNHVIIWLSHLDDPDKPWSIAAKLQVA